MGMYVKCSFCSWKADDGYLCGSVGWRTSHSDAVLCAFLEVTAVPLSLLTWAEQEERYRA